MVLRSRFFEVLRETFHRLAFEYPEPVRTCTTWEKQFLRKRLAIVGLF